VLEGRYVRLEQLSIYHVPGLVAATGGPRDSFVYTQVPIGESETREYVESALVAEAAGTAVPIATIDRSTGRVVGTTRFCYIEFWDWPAGSPHQRGAELPDAVEIGHTFLAPEAQRTGINSEAKLLTLTHAFEVWRVHRVRARAPTACCAQPGPPLTAASATAPVYSMLDSEWPEAKAALEARLRTG
jgi:hypothetical protein